MKHLLFACFTMLFAGVLFPQDVKQGPPKPPPPAKRWEKDSEKIKKAVTLTDGELSAMKKTFMEFYKEMDALHEKNKGQRPPKEEADKIVGKRNLAVKKILAGDKYDKFMKVEKELGPPKPGTRPG